LRLSLILFSRFATGKQSTNKGDKMKKQDPAIILFCNSVSGVYIPQRFAQEIKRDLVVGIEPDFLDHLLDPESDDYWSDWDHVLNYCQVKDGDNTWILFQDGDLWLLDLDRMTEEEKQNFGFDEF
jgi:hypothetical protein